MKVVLKYKTKSYLKFFVALSICFVLIFTIVGFNIYCKQYVIMNNIQIITTETENMFSASPTEVTSFQAEKLDEANKIHNLLIEKGYEWYGSCYYDFDADKIKIGLTENIKENQEQILGYIDDSSIQFYTCKYSYSYLNSLYNRMEKKKWMLKVLGVERYNISIINNCINVSLSNTNKYSAIYFVNEFIDANGAVIFNTISNTNDL